MNGPRAGGLLFPEASAVVRFVEGGLTLTDVASEAVIRAEGLCADEVLAALEGRGHGRMLSLLGSDHPLVRTVDRLKGAQSVALTPASAIAQNGFGTVFLELVGQCNESCVHCYAGSGPKVTSALDRATCEAVLDDAAALGFLRVQFTGGDPLLCDFLPDLVAQAARLQLPTREIYTNGLALTPALLDQLAPHAPSFAFSFYSHQAAAHDAITRTPGSQIRTAKAIAGAVARGLSVRVSIIVMEQNAGHLRETVAFLRSLGVQSVGASSSFAVGRGSHFEADLEEFWADTHGGPRAPTDQAPQRHGKLCVTSEGQVVPCIFNRDDVLGRVPDRRLTEIVAAPARPRPSPTSPEGFFAAVRGKLQCLDCRATAISRQQSLGRQ